jgi:hypothetical protein
MLNDLFRKDNENRIHLRKGGGVYCGDEGQMHTVSEEQIQQTNLVCSRCWRARYDEIDGVQKASVVLIANGQMAVS